MIIKLIKWRTNLNIKEIAAKLGVSRCAIYQWSNKETIPTAEHLKSLSKILKVGVRELRKFVKTK